MRCIPIARRDLPHWTARQSTVRRRQVPAEPDRTAASVAQGMEAPAESRAGRDGRRDPAPGA